MYILDVETLLRNFKLFESTNLESENSDWTVTTNPNYEFYYNNSGHVILTTVNIKCLPVKDTSVSF